MDGDMTTTPGARPAEEAPLAALAGLFASAAAERYLGEEITQAHHMLQAAALAERSGAAPALVAAALLHDIGHVLPGAGDERHSDDGAALLGEWFGPEVTEPVRLHVAAKRYLCAVEPSYHETLSSESLRTLAYQGGPMGLPEVRAYEAEPYGRDAVDVRRWDDRAKDPRARVHGFDHYRPLLAGLVRPGGSTDSVRASAGLSAATDSGRPDQPGGRGAHRPAGEVPRLSERGGESVRHPV